MERKRRGQMSEAFCTAAFLALSGGLQDAYSYCVRGGVFANAQTGNIVLLSQHLFAGEWGQALRYLPPLLAFALGVLAAEHVRCRFRALRRVHWRQVVLLAEIGLLFAVGLLPRELDALANAAVSFACAMQVQSFRKVGGCSYASTMCIGNLRSGVEALCAARRTGERGLLRQSARYFGVIALFGLGAGLGDALSGLWGRRTVWVSCALLGVSFCLLFLREDAAIFRTRRLAAAEEIGCLPEAGVVS